MIKSDQSFLAGRQHYWLNLICACDDAGQASIDYGKANDIKFKSMYSPRKVLADKALNYLHNEWPKLTLYLDDGHPEIDSNLAEITILSFVIGQKNIGSFRVRLMALKPALTCIALSKWQKRVDWSRVSACERCSRPCRKPRLWRTLKMYCRGL